MPNTKEFSRALMLAGAVAMGVVNRPAGAQARWTIEARPLRDLSGTADDGRVLFSAAAGMTRLADGGLLVADRGTLSVRHFDAAGRFTRAIGAAGDGPGEFRDLRWAGRCGRDTLALWDARRRMLSLVTPAGVSRSIALPARAAGDTARLPIPGEQLGCLDPRGIAYLSSPAPGPTRDGALGLLTHAVVADSEGRVVWRQDSIRAGEAVRIGRGGGVPRPLSAAVHLAVVGSTTVIAESDSGFAWIVARGAPPRRIRLALDRRAATAADVALAIEVLTEQIPLAIRPLVGDSLKAQRAPSRMPAFSRVIADPSGALWFQTTAVGASTTEFAVFDLTGRLIARVTHARAIDVREIGADYLLASYSDDDDEPHVAVFRLRR